MSDQPLDVENYQGDTEEVSFRSIVLEQYRRVLRLGSVEFHGGFWMDTVDKTGKEKLVYIPATHESFSNGVQALGACLHPHFDEKMNTAWGEEKEHSTKVKKEYDGKKKSNDEQHNNSINNLWHHERARIQFDLFVALSDFLEREKYLSDQDVVAKK